MKRLSLAAALGSIGLLFAPMQMPAKNNMPDKALEHFIPTPSKRKNNFPQGKRIRITRAYPNPRGTFVKNPKIAADMNARHDAWYFKKFGAAPRAY